jgi:hypothetical protein
MNARYPISILMELKFLASQWCANTEDGQGRLGVVAYRIFRVMSINGNQVSEGPTAGWSNKNETF